MSREENSQTDWDSRKKSEYLAKKLFWLLAVPIFMILEYETQFKPYMVANYDSYIIGFIEGGLVITILTIIILWIDSKL